MENEMHFYKIMLSPSTQSYKLRIPEEYVKENRERFGNNYVTLRVGKGGRIWIVDVYKEDNKIWLTSGWEKIVENYSIKYGHFLLFKSNNLDSTFLLNIFDTSGFEIEYDQQAVQISSSSEETDYLDDDDDDDDYANNDIVLQDDEEDDDEEDDDEAVMEPADVKGRLEAYISEYPHFTVIMKPGYVSKNFRYSFPIRHVRKNLKPVEGQEIQLKVANEEKRYRVRLNWYQQNSQAAIGYGWKKFVVENNIQEGDGCVFELVSPQHNAYKVTVFRVAKTAYLNF